jgi:hypothetical protein
VPESIPEQITVAIVNKLAAIAGDGGATYWFTPTKVVRVPGWAAWENDWLDEKYPVLYFVKPGLRTYQEDATRGMEGHMELWLLLATQYLPDTLNPINLASEPAPLGETLGNRMQRDVEKALRVDITLGGLAVNVEMPDVNPMTPYLERWALVEARLKIWFLYGFDTP